MRFPRTLIAPLLTSVVAVHAAEAPAAEAASSHRTDWFCKAGYGVLVHYVAHIQNNPECIQSLGRQTSWDECVRGFDVASFAQAMQEAGAGYVIFTMYQDPRSFAAPNATFDRITGDRPDAARVTRDLVLDLHAALSKHGIPLLLYVTANGPAADHQAATAFGWATPVSTTFVTRWAEVLREFSERYGDKVKGWWVDCCYRTCGNYGYSDETLGILAKALRAGNPDSIIAMNNGVEDRVRPNTPHEDFTAGEQEVFRDRPVTRFVNGTQWHILSPLGFPSLGSHPSHGWAQPGVRYPAPDLAEYIGDVNRGGGVVSIDVLVYRDGSLDRSQLETLKRLRPLLALAPRDPVPPGNLAWHRPARLLSLDGTHELPSGGSAHVANRAVDGKPSTTAQASNEWPWTYEVDLLEPREVRRVRVTFGQGAFATDLRVQVSADQKSWQTVASAADLDGSPYAAEFAPVKAQWIRVSALKPDGPNQKGTQMSIAELEVYN